MHWLIGKEASLDAQVVEEFLEEESSTSTWQHLARLGKVWIVSVCHGPHHLLCGTCSVSFSSPPFVPSKGTLTLCVIEGDGVSRVFVGLELSAHMIPAPSATRFPPFPCLPSRAWLVPWCALLHQGMAPQGGQAVEGTWTWDLRSTCPPAVASSHVLMFQ